MVVFTHTNVLAKDFQNDHKVKVQTWHSFFRWNSVEEWTPKCMEEKKFLLVVIWDEICTVSRHILEMFIDYLLEQKCQPPPFFGEIPHDWLKERTEYYKKVLTDYRAKCSRLQELKKKMRRQNNRVQSDLFHKALSVAKKWKYLEAEWKPSDHILSAYILSQRIAFHKCLELH
ncbi:26269_t:CDS:2 [Gigaspora rosea]|nr:26269_t:CDS:2 [Gigaspora rosea]